MANWLWENRAYSHRETGTWRDWQSRTSGTYPFLDRAADGCQPTNVLSANSLFLRCPQHISA